MQLFSHRATQFQSATLVSILLSSFRLKCSVHSFIASYTWFIHYYNDIIFLLSSTVSKPNVTLISLVSSFLELVVSTQLVNTIWIPTTTWRVCGKLNDGVNLLYNFHMGISCWEICYKFIKIQFNPAKINKLLWELVMVS